MSTKVPVPCRISGFVAKEAPLAVILRKGPTRLTQMLLWNLVTDEITPGQWLKCKIHLERCDISPDGRYFIHSASNYSESHARTHGLKGINRWQDVDSTVISRPPYFSALKCWTGCVWGGYWTATDSVTLYTDQSVQMERIEKSAVKTVRYSEDYPFNPQINYLRAKGWNAPYMHVNPLQETVNEPSTSFWHSFLRSVGIRDARQSHWNNRPLHFTLEKAIRNGKIVWYYRTKAKFRSFSDRQDTWKLLDDTGGIVREWTTDSQRHHFLDVDHEGWPIFGDAGKLWRWRGFPEGKPQMVADLNPNRFEAIPPPGWALEW